MSTETLPCPGTRSLCRIRKLENPDMPWHAGVFRFIFQDNGKNTESSI